jgi:DNA-binding NtrC family response regulator
MVPSGPVLIISQQSVVAALVGMLVELTGNQPVYANAAEQPADAVRRLRPVLVVLMDVEVDAARSDLFFATADRAGTPIVVFGARERARDIAEIAAHRRIPWLTLPADPDRLAEVVVAARGRERAPRTPDRRQPPTAAVVDDDTIILRDQAGRQWIVYDRRGSDRRIFVSEDGETRSLPATATHRASKPAELEDQLARAT